ncbi:MAG TPA: chloride channel protein [Pirellulales bacterium]|jgi:CIC family chloride channel protein|nr:chloride channel protein [Pirellulales bacterium]
MDAPHTQPAAAGQPTPQSQPAKSELLKSELPSTQPPQPEPPPRSGTLVAGLALAVGLIAGLGAVFFRALISLFHNLLFLGKLSLSYDANQHTPPFWISDAPWLVIFVPVIGAVGVAWLVQKFAPEAKGHGVPEVIDAINYDKGIIRPIVAAVKSLASGLSIGSGGSVGREGPIIQIGAAFGSTLGQVVKMTATQRITLIAAGGGAGIAATFNTPVGGILFAVELLLPVVSAATLFPVALAVIVATHIGRLCFGTFPAFNVPELRVPDFTLEHLDLVPVLVVAGLLFGLLAALFVRCVYWFEDGFDWLPGNYYTRHMLGMLGLGVLMYALMTKTANLDGGGHYFVQGVGYATIDNVLHGTLTAPMLLCILVVAKLLATGWTLGSGASGGVFSPLLYLGATAGAALGAITIQWIPHFQLSPPAMAVVGMAAMVGSATGAMLTAIVMLFEMTRDYNVVLPVIVALAIADAVRRRLCPPTIYTLKLLRRGHIVPPGQISRS